MLWPGSLAELSSPQVVLLRFTLKTVLCSFLPCLQPFASTNVTSRLVKRAEELVQATLHAACSVQYGKLSQDPAMPLPQTPAQHHVQLSGLGAKAASPGSGPGSVASAATVRNSASGKAGLAPLLASIIHGDVALSPSQAAYAAASSSMHQPHPTLNMELPQGPSTADTDDSAAVPEAATNSVIAAEALFSGACNRDQSGTGMAALESHTMSLQGPVAT